MTHTLFQQSILQRFVCTKTHFDILPDLYIHTYIHIHKYIYIDQLSICQIYKFSLLNFFFQMPVKCPSSRKLKGSWMCRFPYKVKAIPTTGLETCKNYLRLEVKNMGKLFMINRIFGKTDIFLDNIRHSFETIGWIF